jgi:hypothetical protein
MPSEALSISDMRDESYSFIWQPKVLMNTFLGDAVFLGIEFKILLLIYKA